MNKPLSELLRPTTVDEVVGQEHLIGKGKILYNVIKSNNIPNMIFYGPPGVGKTTLANIIARNTDKQFYKLNATNASINDIKNIIENSNGLLGIKGIVLYLDEIQNFNKKQQQCLLEYTENGRITLISSTTENPYFYVYNALLSRCMVFEFKPISLKSMILGIKNAIKTIENKFNLDIDINENIIKYIAETSMGDLRRALNVLELIVLTTPKNQLGHIVVSQDIVSQCINKGNIKYDKNGDNHYDILSAFQKSIRGSDVNAALHYLARLVKVGDLISICRRLLVIASEDIGLAYPNAITIVKSCVDSAMQLGFPEARIPLSEATILLSNSPKSNSAYKAIEKALFELDSKDVGEIPSCIRDGHYNGAEKLGRMLDYKYPHDYKNNYVSQQYMPNNIKNSIYYIPQNNKMERSMSNYIDTIKNNK
ncbi:replication-associated recombination protein A [Clostridium niameyense]|uniref:Replication-associated recombination protein A n=1 Tax=Clostridium niameyense TaxID=1622073 RepID=A0A6M0R715_9CLOT|nr:replication-associated recombination protein A [Clostridium niameyense]NEZ45964.1 replication-associated recombination protein A [Clostridium niameyense]